MLVNSFLKYHKPSAFSISELLLFSCSTSLLCVLDTKQILFSCHCFRVESSQMYHIFDESRVRQNFRSALTTSISMCYHIRLGIYDGMAY